MSASSEEDAMKAIVFDGFGSADVLREVLLRLEEGPARGMVVITV